MKNAQKERTLKKRIKEAESNYPCKHKRHWNTHKVALGCCSKEMAKRDIMLWVYKCQWCKKFHLTSSPPREKI